MESQDILIIILLIVFWGIFSLYEKLKRNQKPGQKRGFTLRLLEIIIALTTDKEKEPNAEQTASAGPDPLDPVDDIETTFAANQVGSFYETEEDTKLEKYVSRLSQSCEDGLRVARDAKSTVIPPPKIRKGRKTCRKKMREAIIWSEILGPPVALQKQK